MPPPDTRFTPPAAEAFAAAIADAGGVEVFAVGRLDADGRVAEIEVHCRGNASAVPALLRAPRPGEVVIHNHPSGLLQASEADLHLAGRYGEDGVGMVITDNLVRRALWVVEPTRRVQRPVDPAEVRDFFERALPRALPGFEARPGQLEMALEVARAFSEGHKERPVVAALEAGTGTGKSLAYLVPAALWALANDARVAVATYTITLQGQLAESDLPLLGRAGLQVRTAVLSGRGNYLCRRRLAEAVAELDEEGAPADAEGTDASAPAIRRLAAWAEGARRGSRGDLGFPVPEDAWERVRSDHDQTLRARCPHFARCLYYEARRDAALAQVVVVNHHLLLADLALKRDTGGDGILPRFDRVVIDEAHHLEDAATGLFTEELTALAVRRAVAPLLPRRGGRAHGALDRIRQHYAPAIQAEAGPEQARRLASRCDDAQAELDAVRDEVDLALRALADELRAPSPSPSSAEGPEGGEAGEPPPDEAGVLRLTTELRQGPRWQQALQPALEEVARRLDAAAARLARIDQALDGLPEAALLARPQPALDLRRGQRRLAEKAALASSLGADQPERVQWLSPQAAPRGPASARLASAPIEVGPTLRSRVFEAMEAAVLTSATLTVGGRFEHVLGRLGLPASLDGSDPTLREGQESGPFELRTATFPSPFDYASQALLALPRDLPPPEDPRYLAWTARFTVQAIRASGGGAFVLCTSHAMVQTLHAACRAELGDRLPLLRQGELSRGRLLERFRDHQDAVLFGTDSFWEGVSVSGRALRLVLIPRLPFRVPTDPVQQARHERLAAQGQDPFRAFSLPEAVLRLRQGFGRLVRTQADRGAVAILDRRVHERWYGRVFLQSLPPAARAVGPARAVLERLRDFFGAATLEPTPGPLPGPPEER
ncbi:helicase [Myxococcota bacterium]|nr:helicase [Myxococcota bacterium]